METNEELLSKFSNIYIMLLYSIMTNNIERVKHYLSDEMCKKYSVIIEEHIKNNEIQMYDELNVYRIKILNNKKINDKEIVEVELISRYMDYVMDNKTKKLKRGINSHRVEKTNILTFEKKVGTIDNNIIHTCPNCGANLDIHFNGQCSYCHKSVDIKNIDFILTNLETL